MSTFLTSKSSATVTATADSENNIDTLAIQCTVLKQWWERHCRSFSEWFLTETTSQGRKEILLKASPDMPLESAIIRKRRGEALNATDLILPELSLDSLLACNGQILVLLITRRCTSPDHCLKTDLKFLNDLFLSNSLPSFSGGKIAHFDTPFVDLLDNEVNIQSLREDATQETRDSINEYFTDGRLVRAEVWMALKIRQSAMTSFIENLTRSHQSKVKVKPSPTYQALYDAELAQVTMANHTKML